MPFCANCGKQLADGAKFCFECGTKVNVPTATDGEHRKAIYDGEIHKCPNCGDILDAYEIVCETCGWERRGVGASKIVKEFEEKYLLTNSLEQKCDLIRTFTIPNNREDIREFSMLAASNIATDNDCSEAWAAKLEQAYQKAKIAFTDEAELLQFENFYRQARKDLSRSRATKTARVAGGGIKSIFAFIFSIFRGIGNLFVRYQEARIVGIIVLGLMIICLPFGVRGCSISVQESKLEKLVNTTEHYISVGDYDNAKITAYQIEYQEDSIGANADRVEKWDRIRNSLLITIAEKQGLPKPTICVGTSSNDFQGMEYHDVVDILRERGFTDIQTKTATNWFKKDYTVKQVSINEKTEFSASDEFELDAVIIITYYE